MYFISLKFTQMELERESRGSACLRACVCVCVCVCVYGVSQLTYCSLLAAPLPVELSGCVKQLCRGPNITEETHTHKYTQEPHNSDTNGRTFANTH